MTSRDGRLEKHQILIRSVDSTTISWLGMLNRQSRAITRDCMTERDVGFESPQYDDLARSVDFELRQIGGYSLRDMKMVNRRRLS